MLNVGNVKVPVCHGLTRRSFLQAGTAGLAGMMLPNLMRLEAEGAVSGRARIRNCITIFLVGSPGHLDTWDMKPDAPAEVRGKFRPIATNVPGIQICEHFPLMARMMDKVALIRSLHYRTGATHENGQRWMMTGHDFNADSVQPHAGSVISRVFGPQGRSAGQRRPSGTDRQHRRRPAARPDGRLPGQRSRAVLPQRRPGPAAISRSATWKCPPAPRPNASTHRRRLLSQLDELQRRGEAGSTQMHDSSYRAGLPPADLAARPSRAFDLSREPDKLRDRYGRNTFGQSCLLARRLIEGGVRYVTVNHFDTVFGLSCWDMHADGGGLNNTYLDYERHLCPQFDLAFTALIEDLQQRGMLEETVVAVLSEFGRTPQINGRGGRDHYPAAWTNFLCGGSIRGGQVIGSTDKIGARPKDTPIEPPQVLASIYQGMGINLDTTMMPGPGDRPIRLVEAEPIRQLFA